MSGDYVNRLRAMLDRDPDRFLSTEEGDLLSALDELERLRAQVGEEEVSWAVCAGYDADGDEIYHSTAEEYAREAAAKGIPVTKWVTRIYPTTVYGMELDENGEWQEMGDADA